MLIGKGKKDDDWSDGGSDVELKEVSDDDIAKPVSKKKSKLYISNNSMNNALELVLRYNISDEN